MDCGIRHYTPLSGVVNRCGLLYNAAQASGIARCRMQGGVAMRQYTAKSQDKTVLVRLAWFSIDDPDNKYHICLHCPQYSRIKLENLRIVPEDEIEQCRVLCSYCTDLSIGAACGTTVLEVTL